MLKFILNTNSWSLVKESVSDGKTFNKYHQNEHPPLMSNNTHSIFKAHSHVRTHASTSLKTTNNINIHEPPTRRSEHGF